MYLLKPEKCCYPNCYECPYDDCGYEGVSKEEVKAQNEFDKGLEAVEPFVISRRKRQNRYNKSEKGVERKKRYEQKEKAKERQKKYNSSEKGKERATRYAKSEKGKETKKRKAQKIIDSGKNAEYCRRYYYKKKMAMSNG